MGSSGNPFADFWAWLTANKANSLVSAIILVLGLSAIEPARSYAIPLGVIIMCAWFWKWQRQGGQL